MMAWFTTLLNRSERKDSAAGPRCLSIIGVMLSGPRAFEFLLRLMALAVWAAVMLMAGSLDFCLMFLRTLLNSFGLVVVAGVNWELNLLAILLLFRYFLELNEML